MDQKNLEHNKNFAVQLTCTQEALRNAFKKFALNPETKPLYEELKKVSHLEYNEIVLKYVSLNQKQYLTVSLN